MLLSSPSLMLGVGAGVFSFSSVAACCALTTTASCGRHRCADDGCRCLFGDQKSGGLAILMPCLLMPANRLCLMQVAEGCWPWSAQEPSQ